MFSYLNQNINNERMKNEMKKSMKNDFFAINSINLLMKLMFVKNGLKAQENLKMNIHMKIFSLKFKKFSLING